MGSDGPAVDANEDADGADDDDGSGGGDEDIVVVVGNVDVVVFGVVECHVDRSKTWACTRRKSNGKPVESTRCKLINHKF